MSETALRQLLASFVIEVDRAGELAKGNAAIDALKSRLGELQTEFAKVRAPAERAGKAIHEAFQKGWGSVPGLGEAMQQSAANRSASLFGSFGAGSGLDRADTSPSGPMLGPTRETLNAARQATAQADVAAAKYAGTLRGRLASAVQAARDGFNRAGGGGGGPGLIASLATARNAFLGLAGGATVAGVKHLVDSIGDISEGAQRLGVSTDQFQRLNVLAGQNNTSVEALGTAFRNLSNAAVQPTKQTAAAFEQLGVTTKDSSGQFKSANDLFFDSIAALAGVTDETKRNALAQDLLGRSALELKPLFANGTAAVHAQRKALGELNVLSPETIAQADELSDSWKTFGPRLLSAAEPLIKVLLPALKGFTEFLAKGVDALGKFLRQTDLVSVALTALGAAFYLQVLPGLQLMVGLGGGATRVLLSMAGAAGKLLWNFIRLAIPLLLIEDFITFLRGGDSETGRLLDAVFGEGTAEGTLKALYDLKDAFVDLWKWILGDGQGETAKKLYDEISEGITVIANDLAALLGIGKGGTNGAFSQQGDSQSWLDRKGDEFAAWYNGKPAAGDMAVPALPPAGFYGPPTAEGSAAGNAPVFGDTNVTVNMGASATPGDVGRAVVSAEREERDRLIASAGGFP